MKTTSRLCLLAVAAVALVLVAACGSDSTKSSVAADCQPRHEVKTVSKGVLTVAWWVYPPFSDLKDGKLTGFEGDLMNRIAAMECLTIKPVELPVASMVPAVTGGRVDTQVGVFYRTAERSKVVRLGTPIISDSMALISRQGAVEIDDLPKLKVGSTIGYLWDEDIKNLMAGGSLKQYPDLPSMFADLKAGRIDVALDTAPSAEYRLRLLNLDATVTIPKPDDRVAATKQPGQTNFFTNLKNSSLGPAMDENIEQLREDGTIAKLLEKYKLPAEAADPGKPDML
jgi:polar amino acid transport system substrate-binding protein